MVSYNLFVVVWSIYRAHAPQRSSFPYPRLFFGDLLIIFIHILLQFIGHIILCPLTINPANIIANVSVNNSRTGSASEIKMSNSNNSNTGIVLSSRYETVAKATDEVLRKIGPYTRGQILKGLLHEIQYRGVVFVIESPEGLWAIYIKSRDGQPAELLLGWGYKSGVISGEKPTSSWREDYRILGATPEMIYRFKACDAISHYGDMVDYLSGARTLEEILTPANE